MKNNNILSDKQLSFIEYLLSVAQGGKKNIPSIKQIGQELGLSIPCVREQMELARNLGLIKVQPRKGISILPYDFSPAVVKSLYYAIKSDIGYFHQYSILRNQLEKSFFIESAKMLDNTDIFAINSIVQRATDKLNGNQIQIPHKEHRSFHLRIYSKLDNIFVKGLLESYWDMYELVGLDHFIDLSYLEKVWDYHGRIIMMISSKEYKKAYQLLEEHINLIYKREDSNLKEIR
jgi:DNA-binding FadR family transcriptional regulator